jgi:hypothetical protein
MDDRKEEEVRELIESMADICDWQIQAAHELAEELVEEGHEDINGLDMLDALASTGLILLRMDGFGTLAYQTAIHRAAKAMEEREG